MHTKEAEAALRAALADAGVAMEDMGRVFVTHLHPDHIGMAGTLELAGAEIVMHGPELENATRMWSRDHSMIDQTYAWFERHGMPAAVDEGMRESWLEIGRAVDAVEHVTSASDGEDVDLGGRRLRLKWTPGHTDYHAVLVDGAERVLFSGDHVLPRITSNVGLYPYSRDDPLGDFLDALRAVRKLPVTRVLPAHGDPFDDLPGRVDQILAHHEDRLRATLDAIGDGERDAYAVCRTLFPVLRSPHEERFALAETLAHLRYLERLGTVRELVGVPARWRTTKGSPRS
jgi:glyoxylase-like metal-dependent hydrolase (beta-lactamase superfamily II)